MIDLFYNPWIITIGGGVIVILILYYIFGIGKQKSDLSKGGRGGDALASGINSTAIGGKGGGSGPGGQGGNGGNAEANEDNSFVMGGEGGESGQIDRGGKGGRGPLHVLMEDHPKEWRKVSKIFNIKKEDANKYGKGGDGSSSSITEL